MRVPLHFRALFHCSSPRRRGERSCSVSLRCPDIYFTCLFKNTRITAHPSDSHLPEEQTWRRLLGACPSPAPLSRRPRCPQWVHRWELVGSPSHSKPTPDCAGGQGEGGFSCFILFTLVLFLSSDSRLSCVTRAITEKGGYKNRLMMMR